MLSTGTALLIVLVLIVGGVGRGRATGSGGAFSVSRLDAAGTPAGSPVTSPVAGASPAATHPPLYTPITVQEAINVVGKLKLEMTDRGFIPSRFECAVNEDIVATLTNTGTRSHTFSIDELDIEVAVGPGQTTTFTIESPNRLGHYTYYSNTPEDRAMGMAGTMSIFI